MNGSVDCTCDQLSTYGNDAWCSSMLSCGAIGQCLDAIAETVISTDFGFFFEMVKCDKL